MKVLALDPSGTGTTGTYFKNGSQEEFKEYKEKDWKKHYDFISSLVKVYQPNILLFESSNYIRIRGKDMTSLFKLLGAIEVLPVERINSVPVDQVKRTVKELLAGIRKIAGIEYLPGRGKGWMYKQRKISLHQLESFLVYHLF